MSLSPDTSAAQAAAGSQTGSLTAAALMVLAAGILWGTTGTTQALAPSGATPVSIGGMRLVVGGLTLLLLALARGGLGKQRWPLLPTLLAGAFVASYQLCFFAAVSRTGVAAGTLVGIGSSPIMAGVLGFVVRGERPGRRWVVATVLALAGCALLAAGGGGISVNPVGMLLAVAAGVSYASYTIAIKGLLPGRSAEAVMAVVFCIGALLLSPLLLTSNLQWIATPKGATLVLYLGVMVTALSYWLFVRGLRTVPVATAVTLSLAEPLTAALLGIFFLGERLSMMSMSGIPLLFAGLVVLAGSVTEGK
ncbi:EamA family transporter [Geomonas sp. Red32]|uniref:DMT family transporter n=1 Tax=Geomonas sp. Red32 TaxID=2912856 RepID=UPI00202CBA35|nr:EamA family transporter [Geomonas sp. Red32]MCM0080621.1 EamA family transporter [Geomonas sp. Red32]